MRSPGCAQTSSEGTLRRDRIPLTRNKPAPGCKGCPRSWGQLELTSQAGRRLPAGGSSEAGKLPGRGVPQDRRVDASTISGAAQGIAHTFLPADRPAPGYSQRPGRRGKVRKLSGKLLRLRRIFLQRKGGAPDCSIGRPALP